MKLMQYFDMQHGKRYKIKIYGIDMIYLTLNMVDRQQKQRQK